MELTKSGSAAAETAAQASMAGAFAHEALCLAMYLQSLESVLAPAEGPPRKRRRVSPDSDVSVGKGKGKGKGKARTDKEMDEDEVIDLDAEADPDEIEEIGAGGPEGAGEPGGSDDPDAAQDGGSWSA